MTQEQVDFYILGLDIQASVSELHSLTKVVKDLDDVYTVDPSDDNRMFLEAAIEEYKRVVDKTRIQLEAYFAEENKAGIPTDFMFRRLYAKLKNAY